MDSTVAKPDPAHKRHGPAKGRALPQHRKRMKGPRAGVKGAVDGTAIHFGRRWGADWLD